jgi:hypothetical protein
MHYLEDIEYCKLFTPIILWKDLYYPEGLNLFVLHN